MTDIEEVDQTEAPDEPKLPPRSERKVKLVLKESGKEIECMINPLLMFLKTKFMAVARRQVAAMSKWNGLAMKAKNVSDLYQTALANSDPNVEKLGNDLESVYAEMDKLEKERNILKFRKAEIAVHFPVDGSKQIAGSDIDWEKCNEEELDNASNFFWQK